MTAVSLKMHSDYLQVALLVCCRIDVKYFDIKTTCGFEHFCFQTQNKAFDKLSRSKRQFSVSNDAEKFHIHISNEENSIRVRVT